MSIPLGKAVLCEDCAHITASTGDKCDNCGSTAIYPLHRWMQPQRSTPEVEMLEKAYRGETK